MEAASSLSAQAIMRTLATIVLAALGVVAAWQLAVIGFALPAYIVPTPAAVLQAFMTKWDVLSTQTLFTLTGAALGLVLSITFAVCTAVAFSLNHTLAQASLPVLIACRSMPAAAIAPILMLFLGRGLSTSIAVVAIVTFFPL